MRAQSIQISPKKAITKKPLFVHWLLASAFCFFSLVLACDPRPHGHLEIIEGQREQIRETATEAVNQESSEPLPSERFSNEPIPEETFFTEQRDEEPQHLQEAAPQEEAPANPDAQEPEEAPLLPEESAPEEQNAPEERPASEARPESPEIQPDPVGTPCQAQGAQGVCLNTADCLAPNRPVAGYCPGPSTIQCCVPQSSSPACDPNTQPQPNIGLSEPPGLGGCPAGMARVAAFCIDRWEASLAEVLPSGQLQPWSPFFNPGTRRVRALSIPSAVPQGYINGDQAKLACLEAGKRLCTDTEWLRACQGTQSWTYPYGTQRQPGVCNDARSIHPAVEYFGSSESWVFSRIQHPCLNQLPQSLEKTGARSGCVTPEGIFDMMGNLHEWTADPTGTFRGGFYVDTYRNGNGCLYRTTAHNTLHWDYSTGFRCCANPPTP